jgi:hypothetical protein
MVSNTRVVVTGLEQAERDLGEARFAAAIGQAFEEIGGIVEAYAGERLVKHTWHGKLAGSLHHAASGSGKIAGQRVVVAAEGPQARSFKGGWFSRSGKQPPTGQIAQWLEAKGKDPRFAFAVARKIGARSVAAEAGTAHGVEGASLGRLGGYSFGKLRFFPTSRWLKPRAVQIIRRLLSLPGNPS